MNVLHFSTNDVEGGAARAAHRLHRSLCDVGEDSRMLVRKKRSEDPTVREIPLLPWYSSGRQMFWRRRFFRRQFLPKPSYTFNLDIVPGIDMRKLDDSIRGSVDAVCLHWITDFLGPQSIRTLHDHLRCPILWILMDIEPLTGGCHYLFGCDRFKRECGCCPQLGSNRSRDRSNRLWRRKHQFLEDIPLTFVAPTGWVEARIPESSLFSRHRIERIPLALDTTVFHPCDPGDARDRLGVPRDKKVLFFGTALLTDSRKGMSYLTEALKILGRMLKETEGGLGRDDILLLIAGEKGNGLFDALPFQKIELGYLRGDVALALAYQAADLFVCPSVEDAGPMMIPEAMLCGTPVVAFDTGGAPDLIRPHENGYLAKVCDSNDLAEGIRRFLNREAAGDMRMAAREAAFRLHDTREVARRYVDLCRDLSEGVKR